MATNNGQSRDIGNIVHTRLETKTNKTKDTQHNTHTKLQNNMSNVYGILFLWLVLKGFVCLKLSVNGDTYISIFSMIAVIVLIFLLIICIQCIRFCSEWSSFYRLCIIWHIVHATFCRQMSLMDRSVTPKIIYWPQRHQLRIGPYNI